MILNLSMSPEERNFLVGEDDFRWCPDYEVVEVIFPTQLSNIYTAARDAWNADYREEAIRNYLEQRAHFIVSEFVDPMAANLVRRYLSDNHSLTWQVSDTELLNIRETLGSITCIVDRWGPLDEQIVKVLKQRRHAAVRPRFYNGNHVGLYHW